MMVANLVCPTHGIVETWDEHGGSPIRETCPVLLDGSPCGLPLERQVIEI
jgi:hypothetical protein